MKPQVYLAVAYQHDNGEIAIVFSDTDSDCSFITLRGSEVVKMGDLGKIDMLKLQNCVDLFTDFSITIDAKETN